MLSLEKYLVQNMKVYKRIADDFQEFLESQFAEIVLETQEILQDKEAIDIQKIEAITAVYQRHGIRLKVRHGSG